MRGYLLLLAALAWLAAAAAPATASDIIFYSKPDNTYGWSAGYSYSRGESAAREACANAGGKQCAVAVECDGSWGAVAFAGEPYVGVGASCQWDNPSTARIAALWACIDANHALCWTSTTFDSNGRERSESDNQDFDLNWYAQQFLYEAGYDPGPADGQMGSRTRAAVRKFQTDLGREPTGAVDMELIDRMLDASRGTQKLVDEIVAAVKDAAKVAGPYSFGYGETSDPAPVYTARLVGYPDDKRRASLATVMTLSDTRCTIPAQKVEMLDKDGMAWNVTCAEGPYSVLMAYGNLVISSGYASYKDESDDTVPAVPSDPNGWRKAKPVLPTNH